MWLQFIRRALLLTFFFYCSAYAKVNENIYCQSERAIVNGTSKIEVSSRDFFISKISQSDYQLHFVNSMKTYNPVRCVANNIFIDCKLTDKYGDVDISINRVSGEYIYILNTLNPNMLTKTYGSCYPANEARF